jgi:glycosyltransferase involved in cell wall biosynthesis
MASIPFLAISPNALLSIIGLIRGPDKTVPTPAEDWRKATVEVIIPALNEEKTIVLCLASLARQTLRPRRVFLIDDGSKDRTIDFAKAFCEQNGLELTAIRRRAPIGKTPTIKRQSRESDCDVEFILDSDTILESPNYIERTVQELYQGVGIACACGTVLPMRNGDRQKELDSEMVKKFRESVPSLPSGLAEGWRRRIGLEITNTYRDVLYVSLQKFVYIGQMKFFGSINHAVGCAVAYRRKYVKDLFDLYEPILGDDLTNSEDIFIGMALLNEGYRNIQLADVYCRTQEPDITRLPRQSYMWTSSFLQSCFYFDALVASPLKSVRRWWHLREIERKYGKEIREKRKIQEAYRQPFGREITRKYGRPGGWPILLGLIEKFGYFVLLLSLMLLGQWRLLGLTVGLEIILSLVTLMIVVHKDRLLYLVRGIVIQPVRYASVAWDCITILRFANDLWIRRNRAWRK